MSLLQETIAKVKPSDKEIEKEAGKYIDSLIKPIGALGRLEEIAAQIAGITGNIKGNEMKKRGIIVMSADNGICDEGVASAPQSVTTIMTGCFIKGVTGMAVMAKEANADVTVVDIGVKDELDIPGILNRKIANGTNNFAKGPAMTYENCIKAMETGIEVANDLAAQGYNIIGTGEMGIGNTSSSSCVLVALAGVSMDIAVGKGAGLTDEAHVHKNKVLSDAIALNKPNAEDPIDVVAKVGGFDIAGMAGVFLACAANRIPVVVDGFISAAAALVAVRLCPAAKDYMISSHCSAEPGFNAMVEAAGLKPMLLLDMRLGEGSGCPIAFHVVDCALAMVNNMATFEEVTMNDDFLVDIRE
ncbi:MAG: nicotinate-nucleotide--dimethylbenzimidazole phosphoribosyltransferase [Bacillota bacterium]|nr:nicotinate-nucleotide--dimethylbenzimidazole phosphoribosyltransferase [Bacillota bacterium]